MNRFASKTNESPTVFSRLLRMLPLILGIVIIILFLIGVNYVSTSSLDKQQESLETAISNDIAQCYAVEGTYPPSLEYIKQHYGLTYNENVFYVDYQAIGSNIRPDYTVIRIKEQN